MNLYNVGIIGLGGMGQVMLADMAKHDRFNIAAAWDPDSGKCEEARRQYPDLRIAADASDLIVGGMIDLLYVASPPKSHREYFLAAIENGLPMFCEKPFGVMVAENESLVRQIENAALPNVINFNHGNAHGSTYIETQLRDGKMGDIAGIDVFIHLTRWPRDFQESAAWLAQREQGGFTREMLSHWLYLTRRLLGEGNLIRSHVDYPDDGVSAETHLTAQLDFSGVELFIRAATGGAGPVGTEYTIWGTEKSFRLHSGGRVSVSDGGPWTQLFTDIEDMGANDRQRNLDGVAARFDGKPSPMPDAADGFAVQKLVEALLSGGQA